MQLNQCNAREEPQQYLYFFPLPQGQGALRPTFGFPVISFGAGGDAKVVAEASR
jgi:hypothetical protein